MFIGHFALGYAAKRWVPQLSLAVLFGAAQLADLVWPVLVAFGVEQVRIVPGITASTLLQFISYPYSHSLLALVLWGALAGWICIRSAFAKAAADKPREKARIFLVVLALVVSHWVLDFVTHIPDLPLYPGSARYGLGLWNSVVGTFVVETVMFAIGVSIYVRATRSRDAIGKWAFFGVTAFLFVGFLANAGGTPPPSVTALWVVALVLGALTLALAWWADRHRSSALGDR
jgi:LexA-binding, inner membrane-associated putative hydrolase